MTAAPLVVRWIAGDVPRARAVLSALLGIAAPGRRSISMPGLRLQVAEAERERGTRLVGRLEVVARPAGREAGPGDDDPIEAAARFLALGWATVDLDRATSAWAGARRAVAPRDSLLGARALLVDHGTADACVTTDAGIAARASIARVVLLEPDTEGRLAAALARHGEGPVALYLGLPEVAVADARGRLARLDVTLAAGTGPFGPELGIRPPPPWSPTLIVVPAG